jgi:hypothetical protein
MFAPTRSESRRFFVDAWTKYRASQPLTDLERIVVGLVAIHPEYHAVVEDPERNLDRDWRPEAGEPNPFLHLALHLAVAEQLSIDQPPGICSCFDRLKVAKGDEHEALHAVLECLGEVIWNAQRHGTPYDGALYLACLERQLG